ncbi:hypothetical protein YB2330_004304 [Saitoella coloradoensis]
MSKIPSHNDRRTPPEPLHSLSAFRVYNITSPSPSSSTPFEHPRLAISYTNPSSRPTESFLTPPLTLPIPPSTSATIDLTILARMRISRSCITEGTRVSLTAVWGTRSRADPDEVRATAAGGREAFVVGGHGAAAEFVLVEGKLVFLRIDREWPRRGGEVGILPSPRPVSIGNRNVRTPIRQRPSAALEVPPSSSSFFVPAAAVRQKNNKRYDQNLDDDDWEVLPRSLKRPKMVRRFSFVGLENMMREFPRV